ncbi:hypothetical protein L2E82_40264 [Cichorium intybus]|uniref:Uncharacterized protein n=1 Tax=Cichorium intybus TaxID=13427 RepID=A0ACB9AKI8_CICIN|nr:hypothetical protein L2E82_40264 [Cichorium intybus]
MASKSLRLLCMLLNNAKYLPVFNRFYSQYSSMASNNYTMIKDLSLKGDEYKLKVRIIRLWKSTKYPNSNESHSLDMILMDEQGSKIHCHVEGKFVPRLGRYLQEYADVVIHKPTLGMNQGSYKIVENNQKLFFYYTTRNTISRTTPFDVIGEYVKMYQDDDKDKIQKDDKSKKINFEIMDLEGHVVTVTLWGVYAEQFEEYVDKNKDKTSLTVIVQFARLNFWKGRPYINNMYSATKLYLNEEIDEIVTFKKKLDIIELF